MEKELDATIENQIVFNNGKAVVDKFISQETDYEDTFLTMVQGNSFGGVEISDDNILNNSEFIVNLWG